MIQQHIPTNDTFHFLTTVQSHGWHALPPFRYDDETGRLERVHRLTDGRAARITVEADGSIRRPSSLLVRAEGEIYPTDIAEVNHAIRQVLSLHWEMGAFYELLRSLPGYEWVEQSAAGRLMRSPTVWEDLVKTLLTTNTTWAQTRGMCQRLVLLGDQTPFGHTFPTPAQIAAYDLETLNAEVRAGYRGAYLHTLALAITSGGLDVEAWASRDVDSETLYKAIRALKGFGDYAAASIMRLLGHHDRISIDTACRSAFAYLHNNGEKAASDAVIRAHYEPYGRWRGLVMWMDVLRYYRRPL
jgi:3-methyladenine DNA glycosylase/8-oxoguanine DNA glycosylase